MGEGVRFLHNFGNVVHANQYMIYLVLSLKGLNDVKTNS